MIIKLKDIKNQNHKKGQRGMKYNIKFIYDKKLN